MPRLLTVAIAALFLARGAGADDAALMAAIDGDHRTAAYALRDQYRHPLETLKLFDVQPQHTVVEIWPGGGWYTEILAPYLRAEGRLIAAHYDAGDAQAGYRARSRKRFEEKLAARPEVYDRVEVSSLMFDEKAGKLALPAAADASVDRVVTFRNAHGWVSRGVDEVALAHFFAILKPGGKLGVVQHMADPGQDWRSKNIGYVGREHIIALAEKAGFVLDAEGFFNRNPSDRKDYEVGVWRLPPSLNGLETEAEKAPFIAIGESDRMTLVFRKPL
jgi:predicted methyltransferase